MGYANRDPCTLGRAAPLVVSRAHHFERTIFLLDDVITITCALHAALGRDVNALESLGVVERVELGNRSSAAPAGCGSGNILGHENAGDFLVDGHDGLCVVVL